MQMLNTSLPSDEQGEIPPSIAWKVEDGFPVYGSLPENVANIYYDIHRKEYFTRNPSGRWCGRTEAQIKRHLRMLGYSPHKEQGKHVSRLEEILEAIQNLNDVVYAAPLAGRKEGFHDDGGVRILVTESPKLITPCPGEWATIHAVIMGLIAGHGEPHRDAQWWTLITWLKLAVESLRNTSLRSAQVLALAGPVGCGKSLLQKIITLILGGRAAKAARYMMGRTDFNSDLFEAEHLMLEDENTSTRNLDRLALGANIKGVSVNELHSCHGKHKNSISLRPWWRMSISLNDAPEALMVLPPMDDHVRDKIIILRARCFSLPMPTETQEERNRFWDAIVNEAPAFVAYLLAVSIPTKLSDRRYGLRTFHHPDLLCELESLSPETHLLELIDAVEPWVGCETGYWEGSQDELRNLLSQHSKTKDEAHLLLGAWHNQCGTYLGRLKDRHPYRVSQVHKRQHRGWIIRPPQGGS